MTLPIETLLNAAKANRDLVVQQNIAAESAKAQPAQTTQNNQGGSDFGEAAGEFVKAIFSGDETQAAPKTANAESTQASQPFNVSPEQLAALRPPQEAMAPDTGSILNLLMGLLQNGA